MDNKLLTIISTILASIGALNWGLVGAFSFNLVSYVFGEGTNFSKIVYILVGLSGTYLLLRTVSELSPNKTELN